MQDVAKGVVVVCGGDLAGWGQQGRDVGVAVVHVVEGVDADGADQEV